MKKTLLIILILLFATGCGKCETCEDCNKVLEEYKITTSKEVLENKLIEYGKLVYENDTWLKGGIEPRTYFMTLKELNERNGYDISMFVNPISKEVCNLENTRIEFIVEEKTQGETKYKFNAKLDCGF